MKRSEMILLMYAWMLDLPKDIKNMHDGGQQMYRSMDFILSKIEEAGMLPPLNEKIYKKPLKIKITMHEWEPEED